MKFAEPSCKRGKFPKNRGKTENPDFHQKNPEFLAKTSIFEVPQSSRIHCHRIFWSTTSPDPFHDEHVFWFSFRFIFKAFWQKRYSEGVLEAWDPSYELDLEKIINVRAGFTSKFLNGTPVMRLQRYGFYDIFCRFTITMNYDNHGLPCHRHFSEMPRVQHFYFGIFIFGGGAVFGWRG